MITKNTPILSQLESQFLPASLQNWIQSLASKTQDGETVFQSLHSKTDDDILIQPIYTQQSQTNSEAMDIPFLQENAWKTLTTMPSDLNEWIARTETPSSASMNAWYVPLEETVYSSAFDTTSEKPLTTCLQHCINNGKTLVTSPLSSIEYKNEVEPNLEQLSTTSQYLLFDPFHAATYTEQIPPSIETFLQPFIEWNQLLQTTKTFTTGVNTSVISLGGATSAQEIGYAVSAMVEYLRFADAKGLYAEGLLPKMVCTLSISTNFFEEVAKLRAIRIVWDSVLSHLGIEESKRALEIHTVGAVKNYTKKDPFTNVLRIASQTMAGIVGNATSILIPHFDIVHSIDPTPFSQKIAQQMHHIFAFESGINNSIDPAKGSYYLEDLTFKLAEKGLDYFKKIENNGGLYSSLADGSFQNDVKDAKQRTLREYAEQSKKIVGTSYSPSETTYPQDALWDTTHSTKEHPTIHSLQDGFQSISSFNRTRNSESFE